MTQVTSEGNIATTDIPRLLVKLWEEKFTGALRFEHDGLIKIIYFKEGDLLSASTNDRTDSIGEVFLKAEKLTKEHLKQALAKRKDNESLAEVLLGLGFISKTELTWARRTQLVGVVRSILSWPDGTFTIVNDYLPKREEGAAFPFSHLLLQIVLTDPDRVRTDAALANGTLVLKTTSRFDTLYGELDLDEEADQIAGLVDGERNVAEIAAESSADSANVFKLLHGLMLLGILGSTALPDVVHEVSGDAEANPFALEPETSENEADRESLSFVNGRTDRELSVRRSRIPLFLFLLLLTVVSVGGYFAWRFNEDADDAVPGNRTASVPSPSPLLVEEGFTTSSPDAGATPFLVTAPASTPSPAIAAMVVTPTPAATKSGASPTPVVAPSPARSTPSPRATPIPSATTTVASGNELASGFTIQFAILCERSSVDRLVAEQGEQVWLTPIRLRERDCFRANWGRYSDRASAGEAMSRMPEKLRSGGSPAVVSFRKE